MRNSFVAATDVEVAPLADGAVLYDPKSGKFVMLNGSAERLWSQLSEARTEDRLIEGLCRSYPDIETVTARQAVSQALESLRRLDLVLPAADADRAAGDVEEGGGGHPRADYAPPSVRVLDEEDLLKVFQMTAAEISVASCWWSVCPSRSCP